MRLSIVEAKRIAQAAGVREIAIVATHLVFCESAQDAEYSIEQLRRNRPEYFSKVKPSEARLGRSEPEKGEERGPEGRRQGGRENGAWSPEGGQTATDAPRDHRPSRRARAADKRLLRASSDARSR